MRLLHGLVPSVFLLAMLVLLGRDAHALSVTKGPYVQRVTTDSIIVMWQTDGASDARVDYGTTPAYESSQYSGASGSLHSVTLTGLPTNTQYHYRVVSTASGDTTSSADATFWTAVPRGTPFRFAAYGDSRTDPGPHAAVIASMLPGAPRFVLHMGDFCTDGTDDSQWGPQFFDPAAPILRVAPLLPSLGGHEYDGSLYYHYFAPPLGGGIDDEEWYSFDYGDVHFISLDTNVDFSAGTDEYAWFVNDLQSTTATWTIVFQHNSAYSSGANGGLPYVQTYLVPLYEQYGVDLVLAGHDHLYERSYKDGVTYVVTAGGGADLYPPNETPNPYQVFAEAVYHHCLVDATSTALNLRAIDTSGSVFDSFTLSKGPPPPATDFTAVPTQGLVPVKVTFIDQSTNSPTAWRWTFGDGGTSTQRNPTHLYLAPNRYTVSLTARSASGSDTETKSGYVLVSFWDVPLDYRNINDIFTCVSAGVVKGYQDGSYHPERVVNRSQMATFIARALAGGDARVPTGPAVPSFPDVPATHWAYRYIEYCKANNVVKGYPDGYQPARQVDRAQMAVFIARAMVTPTGEAGLAGYVPPAKPTFPDVPTTFWAYKHIEYLHEHGVIQGYRDGRYHPERLTRRDQMATYVAGLLGALAGRPSGFL